MLVRQRVSSVLGSLTLVPKRLHGNIGGLGVHDMGGTTHFIPSDPSLEILDKSPRSLSYWETKVDSLEYVLLGKKVINVHQIRRGIESMSTQAYHKSRYYERWVYGITKVALDMGFFTKNELLEYYNNRFNLYKDTIDKNSNYNYKFSNKHKFNINDCVKVKDSLDSINDFLPYLLGDIFNNNHKRTPGYIHNNIGIIERYCGTQVNVELESLGINDNIPPIHLYRVRFPFTQVFDNNSINNNNSNIDTIDVEIMEHWLELVDTIDSHSHNETRDEIEHNACKKESSLTSYEILSDAVIELLIKHNYLTMDELRKQIEFIDNSQFNNIGSQVALKAYLDSDFKKQLLSKDPKSANNVIKECFNIEMGNSQLCVIENNINLHNLIVCTLCSCYPRRLLGIPPDWYKSFYYRSNAISNPRKLLKNEFGLELNDSIKLQIHDSTNELRYMVLPHIDSQLPNWKQMTNDQILKWLTRDKLIGVSR